MGWYGYSNTGTCCCNAGQSGDSCVLTLDDFNRPDDADVGPDWVDVAGAEVLDEAAAVTTDSTHVIATQVNPDGPYTFIQARVWLYNSSSVARLFVGYASSSNYLYASLSTTQLTVGQAGGASQSEPVTILTGRYYTMTLCFNGTSLIAVANGVEARKDGLSAVGTKHGFGTGTAPVIFDDVGAARVAENCMACRPSQSVQCAPCDAGAGLYYDIALGVTFTARECQPVGGNDPCANLPSTVRVEYSGACIWRYTQFICSYIIAQCTAYILEVFMSIGYVGGAPTVLQVSVSTTGSTSGGNCSDVPQADSKAVYRSAPGIFTGACAGPYTLNKFSETTTDGIPSGKEPACNVTWPATITVTRV